MNWSDITVTLTWLAGVGAPIFTMYLFANLVEKLDFWHKLDKRIKQVTPMITSVLVSILATYLLNNTELIKILAPYFSTVVLAVLAYLQSQKTYKEIKNSP